MIGKFIKAGSLFAAGREQLFSFLETTTKEANDCT